MVKKSNEEEKILSAKRILSPKDYQDYRRQNEEMKRRQLLKEISRNRADLKIINRRESIQRSRTGRLGSRIAKGFSFIRRGATQSLYDRGRTFEERTGRPSISSVRRTGLGRGRPRGSFDSRYAQYGGVYGYRKAMAQQRWKERREILERSVTNPRQRAIFQQIQQREEMRMRSPEAQTIPNTYGKVPMKNIFDEINDATNIFP
jgi:hypothetical protein